MVESRQLMGVGIWGKYDKVKQKRDLCMERCWYAMSEGGWVSLSSEIWRSRWGEELRQNEMNHCLQSPV